VSTLTRLRSFSSSALSYYLSSQGGGPLLVVASDEKSAKDFFINASFFTKNCVYFPAWDVLPFDLLSPSDSISAQRMSALHKLSSGEVQLVVTSAGALMQKVIEPTKISTFTFELEINKHLAREQLLQKLIEFGFLKSSLVEERGQFSVRGSVLDFFSASAAKPVRVEFEDEQIVSIREFNSSSQRSSGEILSTLVLPIRELIAPLNIKSDDFSWSSAFSQFRARASNLSVPLSVVDAIETSLENGLLPQGVEHFWPLVSEKFSFFLEYLPKEIDCVLLDAPACQLAFDSFQQVVSEQARKAESGGRLFPEVEKAYFTSSFVSEHLEKITTKVYEPVELFEAENKSKSINGKELGFLSNSKLVSALKLKKNQEKPFQVFVDDILKKQAEGLSVAIVVEHNSRRGRLNKLLSDYNLETEVSSQHFSEWSKQEHLTLSILQGSLSSGFSNSKLQLYSEYDIFPESSKNPALKSAKSVKRFLGEAAQLSEGDFVVHIEYGIGLYCGLVQRKIEGCIEDFLQLEYAENSKLFVPIYAMGKVQKYSGAEGVTPALTKLGGKVWEKAKKKVRQNVAELAGRLLTIMAERELKEGISFGKQDVDDLSFADLFPFDETPDQASAIKAVQEDMASPRPMDRLVCGDVGYGKTEVALRAAFKAVNSGYQAAILVPTTVLARQHFETFQQRFKDYPIEIGCLSRFNTSAENKEIITKLSEGSIDIVIGTHRILQADMKFVNLGLLVIDEEHRFGVAAKEKLKRFRAEIDVLTLTATPIPRTLNMSLVGIRDLSLIETAPVNRQVVRTFVSRYDETMAREAIMRELGRGGQVFYIHNRVQSIVERAKEVSDLVPEAKIDFAHGQMKEKELEQVMLRFIDGEIDVLVATTIIESGLDIPNANTILIRDAHAFGLAALYQLRGRVGRSAKRAFAYLFVGDPKKLGEGARKRLEVLQALDDLGIGFRLALQDMEIRGAGNLLGKDQSGQINAVGYELYSRILKEAVKDLKKKEKIAQQGGLTAVELEVDPEVSVGFPSHIPPYYIADVAERLLIYQRMIGMSERKEVFDMREEMEDRYGYIAGEVEILLQLMEFRVLLKKVGATSASLRDSMLRVVLHSEVKIDIDVLLLAINSTEGRIKLSGERGLLFEIAENKRESPFDVMKEFFRIAKEIRLPGVNNF